MKRIIFIILIAHILIYKLNAQVIDNCSDCSNQIVSNEQIKEKSTDELQLLINEIYARKGYNFKDLRFVEYFSNQNWYRPAKNNNEIKLNEIENQNVNIFKERIKYLDLQRKELINQIKNFKKYVLANDSIYLRKQFEFKTKDNYDKENKDLRSVLNKINLDDIHWYKNKGLYKVLIDNGFVIIEHSIRIHGNNIDLQLNQMSHSEIIEGFDAYTDYRSEIEYMLEWQFEFSNGRLKFINIIGAN
ncbi:MAG: YARHG domain-containing protein [Bacteroidales bacterium]|nr:YARHG domain-containing protein [Bacteroidales bacterium]